MQTHRDYVQSNPTFQHLSRLTRLELLERVQQFQAWYTDTRWFLSYYWGSTVLTEPARACYQQALEDGKPDLNAFEYACTTLGLDALTENGLALLLYYEQQRREHLLNL